MTELFFPCVSVSSAGDEYFQVHFGVEADNYDAYFLIQRQFEDDDGGSFYVESPQESLCGHFKITRAELRRNTLRLEISCRPAETVQISFVADDAQYEELTRFLGIIIPAEVLTVAQMPA